MTDHEARFQALYLKCRIEDQRRFYRSRRDEYEAAHAQAVALRNALLLLAGAAGFAAQFVDGTSRAALGVAGALLASLAAAVTAFESLIGFEQLQKLYGDAERGLGSAAAVWRAAIAIPDVPEQVDVVEQVLRTENGQWGQLVLESAPHPEAGGEGAAGG